MKEIVSFNNTYIIIIVIVRQPILCIAYRGLAFQLDLLLAKRFCWAWCTILFWTSECNNEQRTCVVDVDTGACVRVCYVYRMFTAVSGGGAFLNGTHMHDAAFVPKFIFFHLFECDD